MYLKIEVILTSIFGVEFGGRRTLGLVDNDSIDEFDIFAGHLLEV
jgi:hypothetical protein